MADQQPVSAPEEPKTAESADVQQFKAWINDYGRPALVGIAIAVVILLGVNIWRNQKASKAAAAAQALFTAQTPEEFQVQADRAPSSSATAPVSLASAAAAYYNANRFEEALDAYRLFSTRYPGHMLADNARLGIAASLEALERYGEAAEAYTLFVSDRPDSPLLTQARLGAARAYAADGRYDDARAVYEEMIAAADSPEAVGQAESGLLFIKKEQRSAEAAAAPAEEAAPAEAPAPEQEPAPEAEPPAEAPAE
jgi:TolA-binding protein